MTEKKPETPVEKTQETPAYNPALDSAAALPTPAADTYPLLDLDLPPPTPPAKELPPEQTRETPPVDQNPARRKKPQ